MKDFLAYLKSQGITIGRRSFRDVYLTRLERIKKEGSEYFPWIVPVTAAGAKSYINIGQQFPRSRKYEPLDWLEIVNNGAVDLTLILNGMGGEYLNVPAGTSRPVIGKALREVAVRNDHATNSTVLNKIIVTLRRQPKTIDMWAQEQA